MRKKLLDAFDRMQKQYGSLDWWPGESRLEIIVGAVLTQNTNWGNVELAIANLKKEDALDLEALLRMAPKRLEKLIRPAGYFRLKTKRLRNVLQFIADEYGDVDTMFRTETKTLRKQLLQVNGVGPETADSILLYAGEMPSFVIDAYTHRVAKRHGWIEKQADYDQLKRLFEEHLDADVQLYNDYHALLVNVGSNFCKPIPRCEGCPLEAMLPSTGPLEWPEKKKQ